MSDPTTLATIAVTFLLAGFVKGVIGLGLPVISLAMLTVVLGLKEAIALLLVPSFVTNVWQAVAGGALAPICRRLWSHLAALCVATWFGVGILARTDVSLLSALLGALLFIYGAASLASVRVPPPGRHETWLSPLVGAVNGLLAGMTGSFVMPGVMYLQALGLSRDMLIQAMGVVFTVSTVALAAALNDQRLLSVELMAVSVGAVVPALIGMALGQRVRRILPEARFRYVFFGALLLLGAFIVVRSLLT